MHVYHDQFRMWVAKVLILRFDILEMQFADYQVPGYKQDPAVIGNTGCYRLQVS